MAYLRIKEAADKVGVPPHVLRFWETQFPSLKPLKTGRGQRLYNDEDLDRFLKVKHLLYTEGYSIQGAKKALKDQKESPSHNEAMENDICRELAKELRKLKDYLEEFPL